MLIYYLRQLLEKKHQIMELMQNGEFNKVQEQMEIYNKMEEQLQIPIYRRINNMSPEEIKQLAQKLNEKGMNLDLNDTNLKDSIIEFSISKKTIERYNETKQQEKNKQTSINKLREVFTRRRLSNNSKDALELRTLDSINRFITENNVSTDIGEYISHFPMSYFLEKYLEEYPEISEQEFDKECQKIEELQKLCIDGKASDYENGKVKASEAFYIIDYNNIIKGPLDIKEKLIEEYCKYYKCENIEVQTLMPRIKQKIEFISNDNETEKLYSIEELKEIFTYDEIHKYFEMVTYLDNYEKKDVEKYRLSNKNIIHFYEKMVNDYEQIERIFEINKEKKYKDRNEFFEEYLTDLKKKIIRNKIEINRDLISYGFSEQLEKNGFKDYLKSIRTIKKFINEESFTILRKYYDEFLRRNLFEINKYGYNDLKETIYSNKISNYENQEWTSILLNSYARSEINEKIRYINTITELINLLKSDFKKEETSYEQTKEDINNYSLQEQIVEYPKLEHFEIEKDTEQLANYISESKRKK